MKTYESIILTIVIFAWLMWLMKQVLTLFDQSDIVEFKDDNNDMERIKREYPVNTFMDSSIN